MDNGGEVVEYLLTTTNENCLFFPTEEQHIPVSILGWAPANLKMIEASRQIFSVLEQVLDAKFDNLMMAQVLMAFHFSKYSIKFGRV